MGDDHGWEETGYNGHPHVKTPVLDEMASTGLKLENFYAGHPSCSPTRASIMTGKYPATLGITDWIDWVGAIHPARGKLVDVPYLKELPHNEATIAAVLRAGGRRALAAFHGIVIGERNRRQPMPTRMPHQLLRRVGAVGKVRV